MGPLMGPLMENPEEQEKLKELAYIYIVTSILSIIGSGSIVAIVIIKKKVSNSKVRPIFHLSLADLIASVFLLVGAVLFCIYKTVVRTKVLCSYLTALTSSWYLSTFLLTVVYAFEVYSKMASLYPMMTNTRPYGSRSRSANDEVFGSFPLLYFLYTFSWIMPLAITFCLFGIDSGQAGRGSLNDDICGTCLPVFHYKSDNCSFALENGKEPDWNEVYKFLFLAILLIAMLAIVVIYVMALKMFRRIQKSGGIIGRQQYEQEARVRRRAYVYQLAFISCWLPCITLGILSLDHNFRMENYFGLYIVQAIVSPLQGFFNCIIYGWRRQGFMRTLRGEGPLSADPYG